MEEIEKSFGEHFFLSIMKQSNTELASLVKSPSSFCAQRHKECRQFAEKYGVTRSMEKSPIAGSEISRSILNAIPNPVFMADFDVKIIFCNPAAEELMDGAENFFMKRLGKAVNCAIPLMSLRVAATLHHAPNASSGTRYMKPSAAIEYVEDK